MPDGHTSGPASAADDELATLVAAFERHASSKGDGAANEELHQRLRSYCAYAHAEKLSPEEVLIRVKRALDKSPQHRVHDVPASSATRASIISLAIKTYFADA